MSQEQTPKDQIRRARSKFIAMAGTYTLGVFNDNFFKQAACLIALYHCVPAREEMQNIGTIVFTLPWLIFAAPAGWLADRFPKSRVVIGAKALELVAMSCGAIGVLLISWPLIMVMLFIMALQSAIFSPALNGSIPELYPADYVIKANSTLKSVVTSANLVGIILAGVALNYNGSTSWGVPLGRLIVAIGVVSISAVGLLISLGVVHRPAADPKVKFPWTGPWSTIKDLWEMRKDRLLTVILISDSFVWFVAVLQILIINKMGEHTFGLNTQQVSYRLLAPELLGVAVGGVLAGLVARSDHWRFVLGPAMITLGLFATFAVFVPFLAESIKVQQILMACALFGAGVSGGILLVPMESFFQTRPAPERKGAVLAASNFAGFSAMALSGGVSMLLMVAMPDPPMRFTVVGAGCLIGGVLLWREMRREGVK